MKYYLIAGEASGDLHGSSLMHVLKKEDTSAEFRFWGGDKMARYGGEPVKHYRELAFMGFWEVLLNLFTILKNIRFCKKDIELFNPDVIIYIDYPGFNLRIAEWAKKKNFKNYYYISPQIWAWKENRIKKIKRDLDALYVILPFEEDYFKNKHNFEVFYYGNPLIDVIKQEEKKPNTFFEEHQLDSSRSVIALLPGSRRQEIKKMMPVFLEVIPLFSKEYQFVLAAPPGIDLEWYAKVVGNKDVKIISGQTYPIFRNASAAIITSGTATLEAALFSTPQMVCYKSSFLSYQIAKRIITLPFISLVNLIMEKEVVAELLQHKCTPKEIKTELEKLLFSKKREKQLSEYALLQEKLNKGGASEKVAKSIVTKLME